MGPKNTVSAFDIGGPLALTRAATAVLDARGVVIGWSPAAQQLLGYPPDEVIGRTGASLLAVPRAVPADDIGARKTFSEVLTVRHRDGHAEQVAVTVCPVDQGEARPAWVLAAAGLQEEQVWEAGQAMLHGLATQSPIGLAIYDAELRLAWANAASDQEVGAPLSEYVGKTSEDLYGVGEVLTEGYGPTLWEVMRRVLNTGEPVIDLHFRARPPAEAQVDHVWSCSYYRLLDGRGNTLGVCEDAYDITDRYRAQQRLTLMALAGRRIGATLSVEETAGQLADVAVPGFCDEIMVDLVSVVLDGEEPTAGSVRQPLMRVARRGRVGGRDGAGEDRFAAPSCGHPVWYAPGSPQAVCLATGELVLERSGAGVSGRRSAAPGAAAPLCLVMPLRARGVTMGIVTFLREHTSFPFDADERTTGDELVRHTAVCLDNARRYTRERKAAVTLQRTLLPHRLPAQSALEVACRYLPAESQVGVGGDWFDVIPLSGTRVGLVVGDVVGHGLRAAATMGRLRTTVRALARLDLAPGELLSRLDDLVGQTMDGADWGADRGTRTSARAGGAGAPGGWSDTGADARSGQEGQQVYDDAVGATCLYAIYDPVSGLCSVASAGHLPPAVVDPRTGVVSFPDLPPGPPLGLGGLPFENTEISLAHGSLLALYTDGLVESREQDIDVGLEQLARVLGGPARPLEGLCDQTLAGLHAGEPARDDVTMLLVRTRLLDAEQVAVWELPARPASVGLARTHADQQLEKWGLEELAFTTGLVISELVTNALRHASAPIQLRLIRDRTFICEVSDSGHTSPHLRHAATYDEGGRGLFIVAQLVQRWGTRYTPSGKTIWTEQALPPGQQAWPTAA
ncbi:SpoIIE family protein phosphatase [Streptomyces actinomycinicus]|uniref:SpoIIE family protein phosphatase n=1 Tax=Streptomyces actinomycinicus TaxID=1695166 RepID=A0A937EJT4_9ACTN|nr:SpoIIE family protein phosphatase [Streptomyces actinomycinicus]MBL1083783.1 SpoIIE family protein phosphatase [Streptomyces actinomycinicus]